VALTPDNHPDKVGHLKSLARTYTLHYERLGNPTDVEAGILAKQQAENLTGNLPGDSGGPTHTPEPAVATSLGMEPVELGAESQGCPLDSA
jgi:hypothetical protein